MQLMTVREHYNNEQVCMVMDPISHIIKYEPQAMDTFYPIKLRLTTLINKQIKHLP